MSSTSPVAAVKTAGAQSQKARLHPVYWLASLLIAAVLLFYSLRGIAWARVGEIFRTARLPWMAAACGMCALAMFLRAMRWRILLKAEGAAPLGTVFWATAAGYFGNNFLPARGGELVRVFMVSARSTLSTTYVLTTALSERAADAIALALISACVLLTLEVKPGWFGPAARPFAILALCGVLSMALLPRFERLCVAVFRKLPCSEGLRSKLEHIVQQALLGIRSFHDGGRLLRFLAMTAVIWFCDGVFTILGAKAIGLSLSLPVAFLLIAGLGLGSALPSTPGYVGIYQFVAVSVLVPFGFSRTDAIAYILLAQALQYVVITALGLIGFWQYRRIR
jgi:uncharacterized protein (TIRG00374 family)